MFLNASICEKNVYCYNFVYRTFFVINSFQYRTRIYIAYCYIIFIFFMVKYLSEDISLLLLLFILMLYIF
jgi:hypothetical protein